MTKSIIEPNEAYYRAVTVATFPDRGAVIAYYRKKDADVLAPGSTYSVYIHDVDYSGSISAGDRARIQTVTAFEFDDIEYELYSAFDFTEFYESITNPNDFFHYVYSYQTVEIRTEDIPLYTKLFGDFSDLVARKVRERNIIRENAFAEHGAVVGENGLNEFVVFSPPLTPDLIPAREYNVDLPTQFMDNLIRSSIPLSDPVQPNLLNPGDRNLLRVVNPSFFIYAEALISKPAGMNIHGVCQETNEDLWSNALYNYVLLTIGNTGASISLDVGHSRIMDSLPKNVLENMGITDSPLIDAYYLENNGPNTVHYDLSSSNS